MTFPISWASSKLSLSSVCAYFPLAENSLTCDLFFLTDQLKKSSEALVHLKLAESNGGNRYEENHTYCRSEEGETALSLTDDNLIDSKHLDRGTHYHKESHQLRSPRLSAALDLF